jgi:hypothetical protein
MKLSLRIYYWMFRLKYMFHVWLFNWHYRNDKKYYEEYCKNNPQFDEAKVAISWFLPNQGTYDILRKVQRDEGMNDAGDDASIHGHIIRPWG